MDCKRIVLGIGNPGPEYEGTRHNVGFAVLDLVADRLGSSFRRLERRAPDGRRLFSGRVKARVAPGRNQRGEPFLLVKPWTYVNRSGDVAGPLLRAAGLGPESLFVVVDDLNLPLGRIRVRPAGSAGGHNGLRSIEDALGSDAYPRLRLGIGRAESTDAVDHVLSPFTQEEQEVLGHALELAARATVEWLEGAGVEELMNRYNGPGIGPGSSPRGQENL